MLYYTPEGNILYDSSRERIRAITGVIIDTNILSVRAIRLITLRYSAPSGILL